MFHKPVTKDGVNSDLRPKGKVAGLALGYGGGVSALDAMGGQKLGMTEQEEKDTVTMWRNANPHITAFWRSVEEAALAVIQGFKKTARLGIRMPISAEEYEARRAAANGREVRNYSVRDSYLEFSMHEGWLVCRLPSGRKITWPEAQVTINRYGGQAIRYKGINQKTNKWGWTETFGGKLVENITQAVARDCLANVILQLDAIGIRTVFHVHDEVVCEVPSEDYLNRIKYCFSHGPEWADGLPLVGAGYTGPFYYKN
jgi:DNA polymerase